jgi:hypothetical protein
VWLCPSHLPPSCVNDVYDVEIISQESGGAVRVRMCYECQLLEFACKILSSLDEVGNHRDPFYRNTVGISDNY